MHASSTRSQVPDGIRQPSGWGRGGEGSGNRFSRSTRWTVASTRSDGYRSLWAPVRFTHARGGVHEYAAWLGWDHDDVAAPPPRRATLRSPRHILATSERKGTQPSPVAARERERVASHTRAAIHAGGSSTIPASIIPTIEAAGGKVLVRVHVDSILFDHRRAVSGDAPFHHCLPLPPALVFASRAVRFHQFFLPRQFKINFK